MCYLQSKDQLQYIDMWSVSILDIYNPTLLVVHSLKPD